MDKYLLSLAWLSSLKILLHLMVDAIFSLPNLFW